MASPPRSILFFVLSLVAAAICARLGMWQVDRLATRRAANILVSAARALPAVNLDDTVRARALGIGPRADRRVRVTGRFDHAGDLVLRGLADRGGPAVKVVTPLRPLTGDSAVLVIRGYLPSPDAMTVVLDSLVEPGVRLVEGYTVPLVALPDSGVPITGSGRLTLRRLDLATVRARYPYPVRDYAILQLPDSSLPPLPRRVEPPELSDGPHLSYAVQWFSFAVIAVIVGAVVGLRGRRP
jgi:surfeit locus 1 family protein